MNRLQKMLEGANIKLSGMVSDINGISARNLLDFIIDGGTLTAEKYDELLMAGKISPMLKAPKQQITDDLNGMLTVIRRRMLKELISYLDELNQHIRNLDDDIDGTMKPDKKEAAKAIQEIPGIGETSSRVILSVIGTNMERFPSGKYIASWAGLCPGNNESAGKRKSGRTRKGSAMLRTTLVNCAHAAVKR